MPRNDLEHTSPKDRSAYLNAKLAAAIGFEPEPVHPLDVPPPEPAADKRRGASRHFDQIEKNEAARKEWLADLERRRAR